MQWGLFQTAGKRYNAVLSLSYQDWYFPVIAAKQAATEMIGYANLQLNDFDITLGSGDNSERSGAYLCFGKQQWRMLEIQATSQNVDFPIAFTEWCVACGSRVTGTGGNPTTLGANAAFSELATLTHARVFSVETQDYYLLAAGVQQWGEYANGQGNKTVDLHISYVNYYLPFVSSNDTYSNNLPYVLPVGARPNSNLAKLDISSSSTHCYWLTIGI